MPGTLSPLRLQTKPLVSDPSMHHGTCVTHVWWCMSGSLTRGGRKTFPAFPSHAQPAILRIWKEALSGPVVVHYIIARVFPQGTIWCIVMFCDQYPSILNTVNIIQLCCWDVTGKLGQWHGSLCRQVLSHCGMVTTLGEINRLKIFQNMQLFFFKKRNAYVFLFVLKTIHDIKSSQMRG